MSEKKEIARLQKENNNIYRSLMKTEENWKKLYKKHKEIMEMFKENK